MNQTAQQSQDHYPDTQVVDIDQLTALCKASADRLRLLVLKVLLDDSFAVQELCFLFDTRQSGMSHHLKILTQAGLLTSRREGNTIFYRRAQLLTESQPLQALQQQLLETINQTELPEELLPRIEQIHEDRRQLSQQFFSENADKFRAQQDMIANYEQYADTASHLLRVRMPEQCKLALEVGPGDGHFLGKLSPLFEQLVALDNAPTMLQQAQTLAEQQQWQNIEFINGDTRHPRLKNLNADCIVVNMVLHHTPSPADIFKDLADALNQEGILLVTDLCHHDQAWAKDTCGDLWQGFDPDDLTAWASAAGLTELDSAYLTQRNGFRVQVRLFEPCT